MSDRLSIELSRRSFLALAGTMSLADGKTLPQSLLTALRRAGGPLPPSPVVVRGHARFQILSPTVIRMEHAPTGHFIDALSVAVLNRSWPACRFEVHDVAGWVEVTTSAMQVKYKLDSGPFVPENLAVNWKDADGEHTWKPGDVDDKNLGGVPGDIGGRNKPGHEPGALSRNGYFWLDDSGTATWNAATQWPEPRPNREGAQDWYVFTYGRNFKGLLRELAQLLGPIPMVPRYVFGNWFGSVAAYSANEWQRIVRQFREETIPLDLVVLDSLSTAAVIWSGFSWDPEQFPDPKGFFAWMKDRGVKVVVNEHYNPITRDSDTHFDQMRQAMGLPANVKDLGAEDLANKKYAQLYMDMLHKPALDMGMAFWWQDGSAAANMPGLDAMLWTRHVEYEGQERITGKRTFIFCRLGAWGSHRYGSFFTGDLNAYWSTLELLIPFNVQAGNMLVPYVQNLNGGVHPVALDVELYQRWAQFSAFAPIWWWHGMCGVRLPWEYGDAGVDTVRQFLTLRYRLIPYIYTYARLAHETAAPLVRGTWLEYPQQEQAYNFPHQFLFGTELLVAPISEPGMGRPVTKDVYLPAAEHWYDYFTGEIYRGGQVLSYECPLSRMPLFVRAGAILPMAPDMDSSDEQPADPLTIHVFTGKAATFRLYEDDGTSLNYRKHAYAWTPIAYTPSTTSGDHHITIGPTKGRYQGQRATRRYCLRVHGLTHPARVLIGARVLAKKGRGDPGEGWVWHETERVIDIDLVQPTAITEQIAVTLHQAGEFRDVMAVQVVRAYRERVRQVKLMEKLRWASMLELKNIKKQPHVLQVTEQVEQQLNDMVDHSTVVAAQSPDFVKMTAAILAAFVTQPFDSSRQSPELDGEARETTQFIAHKTFTPEELHDMTRTLLACRLVASKMTTSSSGWGLNLLQTLTAHIEYDTTCISVVPTVEYEITLPQAGPPGWVEESREMRPDGSATFNLRAPFQTQGTHIITLRATLVWGPNQTVVQCDVPWVAPLPA